MSTLGSKSSQQRGDGKPGAEVDPETGLDLPFPPSDVFEGLYQDLSNDRLIPTAPWGFAVYRTAYDNEEAWQLVLAALQNNVTERLNGYARRAPDRPTGLEFYHRDALLPRHQMVVFDDRESLSGATVRDVRSRFNRWSAEEFQRNKAPISDSARNNGSFWNDDDHLAQHAGVRYNYCLMVDDLCLEAAVGKPYSPIVMLVRGSWSVEEDWDNEDELYDEDGGWMFRQASDYIGDCQELLLGGQDWWQEGFYIEPPRMYDWQSIEDAPGHWRKDWKKKDE